MIPKTSGADVQGKEQGAAQKRGVCVSRHHPSFVVRVDVLPFVKLAPTPANWAKKDFSSGGST